MTTKCKILLGATVLLVGVGASYIAFHTFKEFSRLRCETVYHSDMSFLNSVIRERLDAYYDTRGYYPEKLGDLTNTILAHCYLSEVPENPKFLKMLDKFVYSTDGTSYEITWEAKEYTHKEHALKGKITFTEMYINGQLRSRRDVAKDENSQADGDGSNIE